MQKFRRRLLLFYIVVAIVIGALVGRLYYFQIVKHEELEQMAREQQNKHIPIPAKRGEILDRNGDKMAFSVKVFTIYAQAADIKKPKETAELIADALGVDSGPMEEKLINATTYFVKLAGDLNKDQADRIKEKGIYGISVTEDTKRIYPYDNLASQVIGIVNADLNGLLGLEMVYNEQLKGTEGAYYVTTDLRGRQLAYGENEMTAPINGNNIVLTIDDTIQYFVEQRIQEALELHQANSASAIVMNPKTGEILAMANKPDFNLNDPMALGDDMPQETWDLLSSSEKNDYLNSRWKNLTISNVYEPGSVFKAITASIALEENLVTIEEKFYDAGIKYVAGVPLKCWVYPYAHGEETFLEALENSCNTVFMEVIERIGPPLYYEYLGKFGLLEKTGISLPSEINSYTYTVDQAKPVELATMSYGHGNAYTMMQVITSISAVVNGGNLMEPHIVKEITDENGQVIETVDPVIVRRVISEETSATMRMMLESVVANGTGHNAYIEGIDIGGKTGSTRKFEDGSYQENKIYASFVGIAPMSDPEFIVLVVVDEPKDEFGGGSVAAPVVKSIYEDILRYKNILPESDQDEEVTIPSLVGLTYEEAVKKLEKMKLNYASDPLIVEDTSLHVVDQFPKAEQIVSKNSVIILSVGDE